MKSSYLFLVIIAFHLSSLEAALKSEGKTHLHFNSKDSKIQLTVDDGFHFNIQAPSYLNRKTEKLKPTTSSEKKLEFQWKGLLDRSATVNYYVCDDAKTVCEPHSDTIQSSTPFNESTPIEQPKVNPEKPISKNENGFLINAYDAAITEAKNKKKLVLIDFSASWCPPCIRLEHETFNTPIFRDSTTNFVLVKIDVDLEENQSLLDKYTIRAFPTLVIANEDGLEIGRILDFLPAKPLASKLSEALKARNISLQSIEAKARGGDKNAALQMGKSAYLAQQSKECLDWYEKAHAKPIEYYMCSIDQAEKSNLEDQINVYKKAIEAFPQSFYSIEWRLNLIEKLNEKKDSGGEVKKVIGATEELLQKWINSPELLRRAQHNNELVELKDLELPELYFQWGTLFELKNEKEAAKQKFELAIQKTLDLKPTVNNPTIIIYLVRYLKKTRPVDEALSWLQKLSTTYPGEYTYIHRQATALVEAKEFTRALPIAEKAFQLSYGKNKFSTGIQLATIKKQLNQKEEAKKILHDLEVSSLAQQKNNSHYLEKIQKTLKEL